MLVKANRTYSNVEQLAVYEVLRFGSVRGMSLGSVLSEG
jgi:hypothetical protein